eukprot:CAMPEP_0117752454 /NCGR_PEP_ID=MMETSP0947-20121206/11616_1 /TAXON_ID=44440 /ORGANISM="Chattonella subsalsa, Strain CCMP2191" /LENGTH=257 /DNA_ID=CAMNT_0005571101 /DNA_START=309 /DNA_END=1082 /DNA_ORIENTATION=+
MLPPKASKAFLTSSLMKSLLEYFDYEEVLELSDEELKEMMLKRNFLFAIQPHGTLPFVNFSNHIKMTCNGFPIIYTAVANIIYSMPIVKHVFGLFGTVKADKKSLSEALKNKSVDLYVGGMAELFLSDADAPVERLYLSKRKGFIKIAMRTGADVIPIYAFGNTTTLKVVTWPVLGKISRMIGMSVTWTYGRFLLPIPMPKKCVYVRGRPLGLPQIDEPTDEDINKWHAKYLEEVSRLFNKYHEKCPEYKGKKLIIE